MLLSVLGSCLPAIVTVSYLRIKADFRGLSPPAFHVDLISEGLNTNFKSLLQWKDVIGSPHS